MTTTPTTDLASALSARRAVIDGPPPAVEYPEVIPPADNRTGEIVSAPQHGTSPPAPTPSDPPSPGLAVAPAPPPDYSMIPAKVLGGIPYASEYARLAKTICNTEMVPAPMRGAWDKVMAAFMRGYEMGLGPMQALDSFNVIEGKVGLGAEAMRALIIQAGHQILLEDIYGGDDGTTYIGTKAECHRGDWPDDQWRTYIFSMADARQAGLLRESRSGKPTNWQTYPRAMCDARATSGAGRRYFPDVLAGMSYTPEEIRDFGGPADQEALPSPSATETQNGAAPSAPPASAPEEQPSSTSTESSPPAAVPAESSATAPESTPAAGSTANASATSPEATAAPAPATASTSTAKKAAKSSKAAKKSPAALSAPAPAASTPSAAPASTPSEAAVPKAPDAGGSPATATAPAPPSPASPAGQSAPTSAGDGPGSAGVLREMAHALAEIIKGQPANQQPLLRAFIREHFPEGIESIAAQADMQKAIDIAVGWPDSATQHPAPLRGEEVWAGFSTKVLKVGDEYVMTCSLCPWQLEEAATNKALPDFRRLELSQQTAQQHETGEYQNGAPFCPGRPAQGRLETEGT